MARSRTIALILASVALGLAIAFVDSRPTWDDTGITVGALLAGAFVISLVAGHRPWLWGVLVGIWVPVWEVLNGGNPGSIAALAFAVGGAFAGNGLSRAFRGNQTAARGD